MSNTTDKTGDNGSTAFQFEHGDDWMRFSADMGQVCQDIGEQVRRAVAQIDVDSILADVRRAVDDIAAEAREAAGNFRNSSQWTGPTHVRVDIRADGPTRASQTPRPEPVAERKAILDLLAQGRINAEEAARLLDALDG
jgi:hypothetical protein